MKKLKPVFIVALKISVLVLIVYHLYLSGFRTIIAFDNFNNSIEYYKMIGNENVAWSALLSNIVYSGLSIIFDVALACFLIGRNAFEKAKLRMIECKKAIAEYKEISKQKKIARLQEKLKDLSEKDGE